MKIAAQDFFQKFTELFDTVYKESPREILIKYNDKELWTNFMLDDKKAFIPQVIYELGNSKLEYRREFFSFDLCIWEKGKFEDNKPEYKQPLYLSATLEHENGPNPEEEFWKLLHWYSPLKILIAYPRNIEGMIEYFNRIRKKVCSFHARSSQEQYLVMFGPLPDQLNRNEIQWRGWLCESSDDVFKKIG